MNLIILGRRFKSIRESLELTQKDVSLKVNTKQNAISNLELGKGGSINLFLDLFNFYSQYVYTDLIFAENFYFIPKVMDEQDRVKAPYWMAIDAINYAKNELLDRTSNAFLDFTKNLENATKLLIYKK